MGVEEGQGGDKGRERDGRLEKRGEREGDRMKVSKGRRERGVSGG